jgi:flagellar biosynthesis protein FliQ
MGTDGISLPRGLLLLLVGLACALLQYACPAQTNSLDSAPSMTALMAAGIVFIVYVQRKAIATPYQVLMFEAFGPWRAQHHDHAPDTYVDPDYVKRRVQHDALASLLLM